LLRPRKQEKPEHVSTITFALLNTKNGKKKQSQLADLRVLFDSGCSGTMVNKKFTKKLKKKSSNKQSWTTKSGVFETAGKCKVQFTFPEFHDKR